MSVLTSLARARAFEREQAVRTSTARHVRISARPLVFVPLAMAGEANAPLACLVGTSRDAARLLVVPQPRNRDLRFAFAAELAETVLAYVDSFTAAMELVKDKGVFADAPQLVVANPGGIEYTRLLGRSTRFRRADGDWPVAPTVPVLGRWLTWFADSTERPGSSTMLALTTVLSGHWATGQSALEDANLAALMGWIAPWDGLTGPQAAQEAEDPVRWPPAGPATDPDFDNDVLSSLMEEYDRAAGDGTRPTPLLRMLAVLRSQMEPTWHLMWQAIDLLRAIEPASSVERRWLADRREFTSAVEYWRDGGFPQARLDHAVRAAQRLDRLERALDDVTVDRAFDDELAMAEFRLAGEAFRGMVVSSDPLRLDTTAGRRAKLRPHITVATTDPLRVEVGAIVTSPFRPSQKATIVSISPGPRSPDFSVPVEVTLELAGGMGLRHTPTPGSVPAPGDELCYTTLAKGPAVPAKFPKREETPWTHGGPPKPYDPDEFGGAAGSTEDAAEAWS